MDWAADLLPDLPDLLPGLSVSGRALALLLAAALVAGFIDAIAGGGGLLALPALLLAGLPPAAALGTNKLQGLFGTGMAALAYARGGQFRWRDVGWLALSAGAGSVLGALLVRLLPVDLLRAVMPVMLIVIALYFALKPGLDDIDRARRMGAGAFGLTAAPLVGFYDGVFGPGAGSFYMLAFIALGGMGILRATAHTKLLNFASNVGAFGVFALAGTVHWRLGLMMGAMQIVGAWAGARLAMRVGARLIKPLLVVMCVALALRLLADPANPIREWLA